MPVTRPKLTPDDVATKRLVKAAKTKRAADEELRAAVYGASDAGASIRVIADLAGLSTATVQSWLKARP